jgi:hypothetical protein
MMLQHLCGYARQKVEPALGIAAVVVFSACTAAVLTFGSAGEASLATMAKQGGMVSTTGKSDKLCGAYGVSCTRRIRVQSGRDASVRVVGANTSIAERDMTSTERVRAAFGVLE